MSGLGDKISGKAKEMAGQLTGNEELEAKGNAEQIKGNVKDRAEDVKQDAGDKVNEWLDKAKDKTEPEDETNE